MNAILNPQPLSPLQKTMGMPQTQPVQPVAPTQGGQTFAGLLKSKMGAQQPQGAQPAAQAPQAKTVPAKTPDPISAAVASGRWDAAPGTPAGDAIASAFQTSLGHAPPVNQHYTIIDPKSPQYQQAISQAVNPNEIIKLPNGMYAMSDQNIRPEFQHGHALTWTRFRDAAEAAAVMAGNYFFPGSSLVTSHIASQGAQHDLNNPAVRAANIMAGLYGGYEGNMSNWSSLNPFSSTTPGATITPGDGVPFGGDPYAPFLDGSGYMPGDVVPPNDFIPPDESLQRMLNQGTANIGTAADAAANAASNYVPNLDLGYGTTGIGSSIMDAITKHPGSILGGLGSIYAATRKPQLPGQTHIPAASSQALSTYGQDIINRGGMPSADQLTTIDSEIAGHVRRSREAILQNAANTGMGVNSMVTQQQLNQLDSDATTMRQQMIMQQTQQNVNNALQALGIADATSLALANMQLQQNQNAINTAMGIAEASAWLFAQEGNVKRPPGT